MRNKFILKVNSQCIKITTQQMAIILDNAAGREWRVLQ